MVLAGEVFQPGSPSILICGKGVVLTEAIIERLNRLDVKGLCVEGHPVALPDEVPAEELLRRLDRRFKMVEKDPRMAGIKEIFRRMIKRSQEEKV